LVDKRIAELDFAYNHRKDKIIKMEKALHAITNEAHPKHPVIFALAMEGLGLEHLTSKIQEG